MDGIQGWQTARVFDGKRHDSAERGQPASLIVENMGLFAENGAFPPFAVAKKAGKVALGP
jgi:hypothetical protein